MTHLPVRIALVLALLPTAARAEALAGAPGPTSDGTAAEQDRYALARASE